ncbi:MAG: sensor domain-containing diguanylate cyclase, partial [Elusimicrobia bacterium]|nr:sensor domain-containing diguanylate cyclase [Elusimicrobiota bacterium]
RGPLAQSPRATGSRGQGAGRGPLAQSAVHQEIEEEILLLQSGPIQQLVDGRRGFWNCGARRGVCARPVLWIALRSPEFLDRRGVETMGLLRLERFSGRGFTAAQRRKAVQFALELSQNLYRSGIGARNRRRLKRMEALTELTAIFASSLRVQDGIKRILQGIQKHFSLDRVRLYLVDRAASKLRGEIAVDMKGKMQSLREEEMLMRSGEHRFVDVLLGGRGDPLLDRYQQTVLHVPLVLQGQRIGLLVVDNMISQELIEPEDAELLKSFAGQIALAVDNARLFDEVQALSLYDSLTLLPVRRFFQQRFQEELYRVQRSQGRLALALLDIDHFKGVNDTYGHQVGDQLLQEVGRVLLASLRKIDFSCRYGGDEILVLLPQAGEEESLGIVSRLLQQIKEIRVPVPFSKAVEIRLTASVGIAVYPDDAKTLEELIAKADEALYWVKSHGRDGAASFSKLSEPSLPPSP